MNKIIRFMLCLSLVFCMTACTYNVSMAHTQGTADDVIDDNASNTPNVSPTVSLPVSPL